MPSRPKRPCKYPGCPNLTDHTYCEQHAKKRQNDYNKQRGSAASRGYDARWRKEREIYLRQHPLCVLCEREETLTPATVVDHIVPHKGDKQLFWDKNNWQALCKPCHDSKTAREDGGLGNRRG